MLFLSSRTKQPVVVCNGWKQMQVASAEEVISI